MRFVLASMCLFFCLTAAGSQSPSGDVSPAFGAKVVDLALRFDDAAKRSLIKDPALYVPAKLTFKSGNGSDVSYDVKIHIKGDQGSKRPLDRKPAFRVKLHAPDRIYDLSDLTLNNMVQDPTMLHEAIGYNVYETAGANVPSTGYVRLHVNGQDFGLYLNVETIDSRFLKRRFGDDSGILYEGSYGTDLRSSDIEKFQLHQGQDPLRSKLKEFAHALDIPGDAIFFGSSPLVDTSSFLGMMAASTLLGDWDNYYKANNYRIYWSPLKQRWFFIPTGIDQTFSKPTAAFGGTGLLFQKCLSSERCAREYADKVRDVADRFERLDLPGRMKSLGSLIDGNAQALKSARESMLKFVAERPGKVRASLACANDKSGPLVAACAGLLVVNSAAKLCLGIPGKVDPNGSVVNVSKCAGGPDQRWHLLQRDDKFQLTNASSGATLPFSLRKLQGDRNEVQIISNTSGKCLAPPSSPRSGAIVSEAVCERSGGTIWQTRQSMFD